MDWLTPPLPVVTIILGLALTLALCQASTSVSVLVGPWLVQPQPQWEEDHNLSQWLVSPLLYSVPSVSTCHPPPPLRCQSGPDSDLLSPRAQYGLLLYLRLEKSLIYTKVLPFREGYWHKTQTHRSVEQNGESRKKPTHTWSINIWRRHQEYTTGKE